MDHCRFTVVLFIIFVASFVPYSDGLGKGNLILTLSTGKIRGRTLVTSNNRTGAVFLGVPFGEAPVGNLR